MRIIIPLGIVALGLMIYSFVECLQTPRERVRALGKWAWLVVIVLVPLIGAGLWLGFGRARKDAGQAQQRRSTAPDDDPNFLRGLEIQRRQRQRHEEERRRGSEDRQNGPAASSEGASSDGAPSDADAAGAAQTPGPGPHDQDTDDESRDADQPGVQHPGPEQSDPAERPRHTEPGSTPDSGDGASGSPGRTPGYRDDVDPDEELDPDDPRL